MGRIDRRKRTVKELNLVEFGGLLDIVDDQIKSIFRINDEEYDYICEKASEEEIDLLLSEAVTFSEKRALINLLNKYVS